MSELTTRFVDDTYVEYYNTGKHELAQIYLKSEADKVIAEKDAEIAQLQAMLEERNKQVGELKDERRWRSVSEELPEVEEDCGENFLVAVEHESNTSPKSSYVTSAEFCNGEWYNDSTGNELEENIECEDCFYRSKVTYWMPMLNAPEEVTNE